MSTDKVGTGSAAPAAITDPEALKEAVRKQVEYYFSKDNLQTDMYLVKLMDSNMSAPISAIMKFAKMKSLTQDEAVLRSALATSTVVTVVDDRIKSLTGKTAVQRSTIILREIPSDTPEAEVREIFNFEGCKPVHSVRSDVGDTWFVVMETEEEAKDTLLDLKLKKRTFRGQSVKCRLKSEQSSVMRSFYPGSTGGPSGSQAGSPGNPNASASSSSGNMMGGAGGTYAPFPPPAPYLVASGHHASMHMTMVGGNIGPAHVQPGQQPLHMSNVPMPHAGGNTAGAVHAGMHHHNAGAAHGNTAGHAAMGGAGAAGHDSNSGSASGNASKESTPTHHKAGGAAPAAAAPAAANTANTKNKQQGGRAGGATTATTSEATGNARKNKQGAAQGAHAEGATVAAGNAASANNTNSGTTSTAGAAGVTGGKTGNKRIEMNSSNFPPLAEGGPASGPTTAAAPGGATAQSTTGSTSTLSANTPAYQQPAYTGSSNPAWQVQTGEAPVAQPGYKGPFVQYSYEDIIAIVRNVQDATLPKNITPTQAAAHAAVMDMAPNMDLLHRQRTFSIDETREQLQQGRPVQREAVMSGNIDSTVNYSSSSGRAAPHSGAGRHGGNSGSSNSNNNKGGNKPPSSGSTFSYASVVKSAAAAPPADEPVTAKKETTKATAASSSSKASATSGAKGDSKNSGNNAKGSSGAGSSGKKAADKDAATSATEKNAGGAAGSTTGSVAGTDASTESAAAEATTTAKETGNDSSKGKRGDKGEEEAGGSAPASAWGSKPSFANVLKLAANAEETASNTSSGSPSKPEQTEDRATQSRTGSSSGGVKKTQFSGHRGGDRESHGNYHNSEHGRGERQHRERDGNSGHNRNHHNHGHHEKSAEKASAMSGGMWRKTASTGTSSADK